MEGWLVGVEVGMGVVVEVRMGVVVVAVMLDEADAVLGVWMLVCDVAWLVVDCTGVEAGHMDPYRLTITVCTAICWMSPGYCAIMPSALIVPSACA